MTEKRRLHIKKLAMLPRTELWKRHIKESLGSFERDCPICGTRFWTARSRNHRFCSWKCSAASRKGKPLSQSHKLKISLANIGRSSAWHKEHWAGSKNPKWKHGLARTKEYHAFKEKMRRATVRTTGKFTILDWNNLKVRYNFTCPACKRQEPEISLTPDHVVPISRGGTNHLSNIQPLCAECNSRKGNRHSLRYNIY
jgi:5-methylcytosine-specific restriction endonuclease McrA